MTGQRRAPDVSDQSAEVAIPRLLELHGNRIYGLGLRMCGNPETAEDLVQETFLRAFRGWDAFKGKSDPSTWLYRIASRICQRFSRKKSGEPQNIEPLEELLPSAREGIPQLSSQDLDALDEQIQRETIEKAEQAITTLPHHFRLPFVLKEIGDFSVSEIATILELKEATVKTRIHRGRLMVRKALVEDLPLRPATHPDHPKQMCLDLLAMKQEALDRGADFPLPASELCDRCRSLFSTLDYSREVCVQLRRGELPDQVRSMLVERLATIG